MLSVLLLASSLLIAPLRPLPARAAHAVMPRVRMSAEPSTTDCLVIGAGISGATLAHNLHKNGVDMLLTEARDYVGGNVFSHNKDGFIWEEGPNSFATQPAIVRIAYELGISDQLVFADESLPPWVNHNGKLHPLPKGKGGKGAKGQLELVFGSNGVLKFGLAGTTHPLRPLRARCPLRERAGACVRCMARQPSVLTPPASAALPYGAGANSGSRIRRSATASVAVSTPASYPPQVSCSLGRARSAPRSGRSSATRPRPRARTRPSASG